MQRPIPSGICACCIYSGGINRDWTGVPRKLYEPGSQRSLCVCVRTEGHSHSGQMSDQSDLDNPSLQEYDGCHPLADWCAVKN